MKPQHCVNCGKDDDADDFLVVMRRRDVDSFACLDCLAVMMNHRIWWKIRQEEAGTTAPICPA